MDIITQIPNVSLVTRAISICINNPLNSVPWIKIDSESIYVDGSGNKLGEAPQPAPVTVLMSNVQAQQVSITDPVTNLPVTISVAGLGKVIEQLYVSWFNAANPA